jgi:hypothetical protein
MGHGDSPKNVEIMEVGSIWLTEKNFRLAVETAATRTKSACADCWNP